MTIMNPEFCPAVSSDVAARQAEASQPVTQTEGWCSVLQVRILWHVCVGGLVSIYCFQRNLVWP